MAKGKKGPRAPKTLMEKLDSQFPGFVDEVSGLSVQALEKKVADYQKSLEDSENHKSANEPLRVAREQLKELNAPYSEVRKAIGLKTKYLIQTIREKGGA